MPHPIPDEDVETNLDLAVTLGVLTTYAVHRHPSPHGAMRDRRRWMITFADGDRVDYSPSAADAFGLGVRLTAEALGVA
jgi:hypothetical protein